MIQVLPMPDEVARSHERRRMIVVGASSITEHAQRMRNQLDGDPLYKSGLPRLHLLALVSGMDPKTYAVSHSMLGAQRVAGFAGEIFEHGSERAIAFSRRLGMRIPRNNVCVCEVCMHEDFALNGFTWYRRAHQFFGLDWCFTHGARLQQIDAPNAFDQLPHHWQEEGRIVPIPTLGAMAPKSDFTKRCFEIAMALLALKAPLSCTAINTLIGREMRRLGFLVSRNGQRPQLSDRLEYPADSRWVQSQLRGNSIYHFAYNFDAAASGYCYAIALALIFNSTSEAIKTVAEASAVSETSFSETKTKESSIRDVEFWHGCVWPIYLDKLGKPTDIAIAAKIEPTHCRDKMAEVGLPSLENIETQSLWKAFFRFTDGRSIGDACTAENVQPAQLEELIRVCSTRVAYAARRVAGLNTAISAIETGTFAPSDCAESSDKAGKDQKTDNRVKVAA